MTDNPIFYWATYADARERGRPIPERVLTYFDSVAAALERLVAEGRADQAQLLSAFGLTVKMGRGNEVSRAYAKSEDLILLLSADRFLEKHPRASMDQLDKHLVAIQTKMEIESEAEDKASDPVEVRVRMALGLMRFRKEMSTPEGFDKYEAKVATMQKRRQALFKSAAAGGTFPKSSFPHVSQRLKEGE
jgi:hypothetical protein